MVAATVRLKPKVSTSKGELASWPRPAPRLPYQMMRTGCPMFFGGDGQTKQAISANWAATG